MALMLLSGAVLPAVEPQAGQLLAAARTRGPGQAEALARLGDEPPSDARAVAAVLVDGVVSTDVACRIAAGQAIRSLLSNDEESAAFRGALVAHAGRLLASAESAMADRINPALEALAELETPSGAMTPRLIALLAAGKPFRRSTLGVLARSRPLTPEIRRVVLAEANGSPLVQQDLAIALEAWSDDDLVGEDIDRALVALFDAPMGNIPPRVIAILQRRSQPRPIVAAHMADLLAHPLTTDGLFRQALHGYAATAPEGEDLAVLERLLGADVHRDPDRTTAVIAHLAGRQGLPAGVLSRLVALVQDRTVSWHLRHGAARILVDSEAAAGIAPTIAELIEPPAWVVAVDSADGWPLSDIDRGLQQATSADERLAWTVARLLHQEHAAREGDKDFAQRRGAIQVDCLVRWMAQNPQAAGVPFVVCRMLEGYMTNYAPTQAERAQCIALVTRLLTEGAATEAAMVDMRYPQGGPGELARKAYRALVWACTPKTRPSTGTVAPSPNLVARGEAARLLHAMRAAPRLVLHADRELASGMRAWIHEEPRGLASCRDLVQTSGFAAMPQAVFVAELEALARRQQQP